MRRWVATGHYARVEQAADGTHQLKRGVDRRQGSVVFLFTLTQSQLACARFPLGALRKPEVRAYAAARALPVADKPDSHEICFVPDGDYAAFVERRAPQAVTPGRIVDGAGRTLGHHDGVHRFTVGQRKGLGLSSHLPLYVTALDATSGRVTVGPRQALEQSTLSASSVNWIAGSPPAVPIRATARIRYRHKEAAARVTPGGQRRGAGGIRRAAGCDCSRSGRRLLSRGHRARRRLESTSRAGGYEATADDVVGSSVAASVSGRLSR